MDYNLYMVLNEKDLESIEIVEMKANWGGENISYSPKRFIFQDKVQMFLSESPKLFKMEEAIDGVEIVLKIVDGLRELEWEVNNQKESLITNNIMMMLQKVCSLDKFSIYIFEDDGIIEQQVNGTGEKNIFLLVSEALNWESPKNVKIFRR